MHKYQWFEINIFIFCFRGINTFFFPRQVRPCCVSVAKHRCLFEISAIFLPVGFTAYYSVDGSLNVGTAAPFRFDKDVVNYGQGYNLHTGIFTAPVSGLYIFFFNIQQDNQHGYIHINLQAAGTILCKASANGPDISSWDEGTCEATTHLEKGQQVFVQRSDGDYYIDGGVYSSFSGCFIAADA